MQRSSVNKGHRSASAIGPASTSLIDEPSGVVASELGVAPPPPPSSPPPRSAFRPQPSATLERKSLAGILMCPPFAAPDRARHAVQRLHLVVWPGAPESITSSVRPEREPRSVSRRGCRG